MARKLKELTEITAVQVGMLEDAELNAAYERYVELRDAAHDAYWGYVRNPRTRCTDERTNALWANLSRANSSMDRLWSEIRRRQAFDRERD